MSDLSVMLRCSFVRTTIRRGRCMQCMFILLVVRRRCSGILRAWMQREGGSFARQSRGRGLVGIRATAVVVGGASWHCLSDGQAVMNVWSFKLDTKYALGKWKCSQHGFHSRREGSTRAAALLPTHSRNSETHPCDGLSRPIRARVHGLSRSLTLSLLFLLD